MEKQISFNLTLPRSVLFGWGRFSEAPDQILSLGKRVYLLAGKSSPASVRAKTELVEALQSKGAEVCIGCGPRREPTVEEVDREVERASEFGPEVVVGCGGGSVIDTAKAVAALVPNAGGRSASEFLEGVENQQPLLKDPLPLVAIPTTAGTGSEATRNAVISWPEKGLKRSLRDPRMVPQVAIVDPELTQTLPPDITVHSGMDAITQLIESYTSQRATPFTDALNESVIPVALQALPTCISEPENQGARTTMAYAALISGMCLANAGLGLSHAVAPALGILFGVPHGQACAALLPFALHVNEAAAQEKLARLRRLCGGREKRQPEAASAFIACVEELCKKLRIPQRLSEFGVKRKDLPRLASLSSTNSLRGNARPLTKEEVAELLVEVL